MKQFTTPDQTAKLIELGFEKPKSIERLYDTDCATLTFHAYSIGELIEMLPPRIRGVDLTIERYYAFEQWLVYWDAGKFRATELIDALYNAIIKLKEEGMI